MAARNGAPLKTCLSDKALAAGTRITEWVTGSASRGRIGRLLDSFDIHAPSGDRIFGGEQQHVPGSDGGHGYSPFIRFGFGGGTGGDWSSRLRKDEVRAVTRHPQFEFPIGVSYRAIN